MGSRLMVGTLWSLRSSAVAAGEGTGGTWVCIRQLYVRLSNLLICLRNCTPDCLRAGAEMCIEHVEKVTVSHVKER